MISFDAHKVLLSALGKEVCAEAQRLAAIKNAGCSGILCTTCPLGSDLRDVLTKEKLDELCVKYGIIIEFI